MRKKWKYDKILSISDKQKAKHKLMLKNCLPDIANYSLLIVFGLFILHSCKQQKEHKHIPTNSKIELNGLVQPTNQSVFSNVKTITPIQDTIKPVFQATGIIAYNPNLINNISTRISGRIEKLYMRFNFQEILKGQRIMDLYSPEIVTAQQEFLYLLNNSSNEIVLIKYSKQKLKWLGLTDEQLIYIEKNKMIINPIPIYSKYSGHIHDVGISPTEFLSTSSSNNGMGSNMNNSMPSPSNAQIENLPASQTSALSIKDGMYVQKGQTLFDVYNISKVWVILNIFPVDANYIQPGDKVLIIRETHPEQPILSKINFIEAITSQNASTIKARVYLNNTDNQILKIGTLVTATIYPKEIPGLWLPRKSVLNLGESQVTFIKVDDQFVANQIKTGIITDSLIQIISGIDIRDSIALNAQYLIDSESFIKTENEIQ